MINNILLQKNLWRKYDNISISPQISKSDNNGEIKNFVEYNFVIVDDKLKKIKVSDFYKTLNNGIMFGQNEHISHDDVHDGMKILGIIKERFFDGYYLQGLCKKIF